MTKLAIREALLPGGAARPGLAWAREQGLAGVELAADGLDARIDEVADALQALGLAACGINMGAVDGWVSADIERRRRAEDSLREALACALDLQADYVSFVPQYGAGDMPDLTPVASPQEMRKQLLIWLLRGFSDLAEAMDAKLALLPRCQAKTTFLTRLEQAASFCRAVDDHPMITLAASVCDAALEDENWLGSLEAHLDSLSAIYLVDSDDGLPGAGALPFPELGAALQGRAYSGWLVVDGRVAAGERERKSELGACLDYLRACGLC